MKIPFGIFIFCVVIISACKQDSEKFSETELFSIAGFHGMTNWPQEMNDSVKVIELDYFNTVQTGFDIPGSRQTASGYFTFSFKIKNKSSNPVRFRYKIYYQNESYKFFEFDSLKKKENEFDRENFYGSWSDSLITFRMTEEIPADGEYYTVYDSLKITGNPRFEEKYYNGPVNGRWKRNPRVGLYSFLLAVERMSDNNRSSIPDYIRSVSQKDGGHYVNPYYYFLYGPGRTSADVLTLFSAEKLKVIAHPDLGAGIFINGGHFPYDTIQKYATPRCGCDSFSYKNAPFAQFIHFISDGMSFRNIPLIRDVLGEGYSKSEYNWYRSFTHDDERISSRPSVAGIPCQNVHSDSAGRKITLINPASSPGDLKKENSGIISRNGLCYGKFRVKAKLTELLNRDNVWNGITNAIWLINQPEGTGEGKWNNRRPCTKEGYMANYYGGRDDKRVESVAYSEIDFEILKTPSYCPYQDFPPVYPVPVADPHNRTSWDTPLPDEVLRHDGDITVACTNWDMACWQPDSFGVGCNPVVYNNQVFQAHRWDHWYRALTEKTYANDDSMFGGDYYYFEIEWKPTEIIWRVGPEPDEMYIVGYMNDKVTSIPDNQMLLIITQEFHTTRWWPGSPYKQENIPFPGKNYQGNIYDITIE
ncbi:MAG: hypothetical protein IT242_01495 [Bacteroidia bacterium]|nr:hypothetical protein [Bacteroidia bacterium]